jgi:hypothetical protein
MGASLSRSHRHRYRLYARRFVCGTLSPGCRCTWGSEVQRMGEAHPDCTGVGQSALCLHLGTKTSLSWARP